MKRYSSAASLALAVLAVLGLAGPAAAGEQVPFKGSLEGDVTITPLDPAVRVRACGGRGQRDPPGSVHVGHPARREPREQDRDRVLRVHGGQRRHGVR